MEAVHHVYDMKSSQIDHLFSKSNTNPKLNNNTNIMEQLLFPNIQSAASFLYKKAIQRNHSASISLYKCAGTTITRAV